MSYNKPLPRMKRDAEAERQAADPDGGLVSNQGKSIIAFVGDRADHNHEPPAWHPEPAGGLLNEASRIGAFVEDAGEDEEEEEEEDPNKPAKTETGHHVTFADKKKKSKRNLRPRIHQLKENQFSA